jgi:hypothetical protein
VWGGTFSNTKKKTWQYFTQFFKNQREDSQVTTLLHAHFKVSQKKKKKKGDEEATPTKTQQSVFFSLGKLCYIFYQKVWNFFIFRV